MKRTPKRCEALYLDTYFILYIASNVIFVVQGPAQSTISVYTVLVLHIIYKSLLILGTVHHSVEKLSNHPQYLPLGVSYEYYSGSEIMCENYKLVYYILLNKTNGFNKILRFFSYYFSHKNPDKSIFLSLNFCISSAFFAISFSQF